MLFNNCICEQFKEGALNGYELNLAMPMFRPICLHVLIFHNISKRKYVRKYRIIFKQIYINYLTT